MSSTSPSSFSLVDVELLPAMSGKRDQKFIISEHMIILGKISFHFIAAEHFMIEASGRDFRDLNVLVKSTTFLPLALVTQS